MKDLSLIGQIVYYLRENSTYILSLFARHFLMTFYGVLIACILAIPLGFLIARHDRLTNFVIALANAIQTIPTLAMLSILMLIMGLGANTVVVTVFLYSLLPILKNTVAGVRSVSPSVTSAAKGMGMTKFQIMRKIELPLASPVIMAGVRNAMVTGIGIAAIGTFIGAGGLGDIITRGVAVTNGTAIIIVGAVPTALMAIILDLILSKIEEKMLPENAKK